jgi:Putative auto-transporter adhesin, head GIN domain
MRKAVIVSIAAIGAAAAGCNGMARSESGPSTSRAYAVGAFDRVAVAGPYEVTVRTGAAPAVRASGPQRDLDELVVEVKSGILRIHPRDRTNVRFGWHSHGKVELAVSVPSLRGAELAGSGGIRIDRIAGDSFDGSIAGSGDLNVDRVEVAKLRLGVTGSGNARAASGQAKAADYAITGSGGIDAKGVRTDTASVSVAGSGDVAAQASRTAAVNIMGSGDVVMTGGAHCTVAKAGSGEARCS